MSDETGEENEAGTKRQQPRAPQSWTDLTNNNYNYPDELLAGDMSWRDRRRGKKAWRKADRAETAKWIREKRREQEPASPATILVAVVLLVLVVVGAAKVLPRFVNGPGNGDGVTVLKPTEGATARANPTTSGPTLAPTPTNTLASTPPSTAPLSDAAASTLLQNWARDFYTRRPAAQTYSDLVDQVGKTYFTAEAAESLKEAGDTTYDALEQDGGISSVSTVTVTRPLAGSGAPADTPTRKTKAVATQITVTGKNPATFGLRVLVTVVPDQGSWRISSIAGASG